MELATARTIERLIVVGCVPMLLVIGYKLFILGAKGEMQLSTSVQKSFSAKLTNVTPGALCFVLAIGLGCFSLFSKYETSTSVESGVNSTTTTSETHYLGGNLAAKKPLPLGMQLRGALTEIYLCEHSKDALSESKAPCTKDFNSRFKRMPSSQDFSDIDKAETEMNSDIVEKRIAGAEQYQILARAFLR